MECLKQYKIVYLMSGNNYKLPGDKVLPNNDLIGEMAAEHLVKKGHKDLLFVTVASQHEKTTTMGKRWESFSKTARLLDASATLLTIDQKYEDVLGGRDASDIIGEKISAVFGGSCNPTGMFVCFDSLTATLYPILNKSGVKPGEDIEILSCNNEKSFLMGLDPMPISIDIHPELIGKRAVEQLIWRAGHPEDETNISIEITAELSI